MEKQYSVIVPIYNAESTLPHCIDSLVKQLIADYELLLVNDGSTDGSGSICQDYAARYPQIRYFQKGNGGVSSARNLGLEQAEGEYILFVDSDDYVSDDYFTVIDRELAQHPADLLMFGAASAGIGEKRTWITGTYYETEEPNIARRIAEAMQRYLFSSMVSKCFRAELIRKNKMRFCEDLAIGEDQNFLFEYAMYVHSIASVADVLYLIDTTDKDSLSRKPRSYLTEQLMEVNRRMYRAYRSVPHGLAAAKHYEAALAWMTYRSVYTCCKELLKFDYSEEQHRHEMEKICRRCRQEKVKPLGWKCRMIALPVQLGWTWMIDRIVGYRARPQNSMNKRKILILPSKLTIGGAEKVAADIGLHADRSKYEIHYVVFGDEIGVYEPELEACGCKIFHIPQPSESFTAYLKNLKHLIRTYHYDVIHAHTMFNIGWAMLAGKLYGVPVRVSHAHSTLVEKCGVKVRLYETAMRFLILTCATSYVACGVKAGERLYGKKAFRKKGTLILNGIDTQCFAFDAQKRDAFRKELGLDDKFIIGHTGHLASVKNQSFLLSLMPEIRKRQPQAYLLLLGEGEDRPMLEQKIHELHLEDHVRMTGNVRNVPDYLNAMDVFAFPSLYEGMPLSIIEVQSNGLPCVISDHVPKDVFLTDLLQPLPLDAPERWADAICTAARAVPEKYASEMRRSGFDAESAMQKIYRIYSGSSVR